MGDPSLTPKLAAPTLRSYTDHVYSFAAPRLCCLDLDTFFVSVERLFNPALEGKPVVVGGRPGQRGVVTAASYEVRAFGVRSGMSLTEASRLAPHAVFLPTRHGVYSEYSAKVRAVVERVSPVVRMASIDEMYMDFTGCERLYHQAGDESSDATIERVVRALTRTIASEIGLPASVGIGTSKPIAKIASGIAKPRGVLLIPAGQEAAFLAPLPVRKYPGIGPVAEQRLAQRGIHTLGQLVAAEPARLQEALGISAPRLQRGAGGEARNDLGRERPAFQEHDPEGGVVGSISNERTFHEDVSNPACIKAMLGSLCERVCWRARKRGVVARTVSVKLRYGDFQTLSRARTITPTNAELVLLPVVIRLFNESRTRRTPIRLLGVALSNLQPEDQQPVLFSDNASLYVAVDALRGRYGYDVVRVASSIAAREPVRRTRQ